VYCCRSLARVSRTHYPKRTVIWMRRSGLVWLTTIRFNVPPLSSVLAILYLYRRWLLIRSAGFGLVWFSLMIHCTDRLQIQVTPTNSALLCRIVLCFSWFSTPWPFSLEFPPRPSPEIYRLLHCFQS